MANPQIENGYTKVANEILERVCQLPISGSEFRVFLYVVRKTWGFNKKVDAIPLTQFESGTGMKRVNVCRALKELVVKRLLLKGKQGYTPNKDYDEWVVVKRLPREKGVVNKLRSSSQLTTKKGSLLTTLKRKKETNQKKVAEPEGSAGIPIIIDAFKDVNPSYRKWFANKTQRGAVDRLLTLHGADKLLRVVKLLQRTNTIPYLPTITTPVQLEDKWASLEAGLVKKKNQGITSGRGLA